MIRQIRIDEVHSFAVALGDEFYVESGASGVFSLETFVRSWVTLIDSNVGVMFGMFDGDVPVGAVGGGIFQSLYTGEDVATEFFWFVTKNHRRSGEALQLLQEFETWAFEQGAKRIDATVLFNEYSEIVSRIYVGRGYKAVETHYFKEL